MNARIKRGLRWTATGLVVVGLAIQFVPVDRSNPPVTAALQAPSEVHSILERACFDCHSNETTWPWYSRIAPVSWLVAQDVHEGREALNFSRWRDLSGDAQAEMLEETWEEVAEGEMPPFIYTAPHPAARLSAEDRTVLRGWALGGLAAGSRSEHEED